MQCFVGFYGLTRALARTAPSIWRAVCVPLAGAGYRTVRAGHFNLPERIDNPRSGERGLLPESDAAALLDLEACVIEPQDDAAVAAEHAVGRAFPDRQADGYRSLLNLCHQLRSLEQCWDLLRGLGAGPADPVLLLRADLDYLDPVDPSDLDALRTGATDVVVPGWQAWGGLNDRFALCSGRAAAILATRRHRFADGCLALGGMHAERFLGFVAADAGLRVRTTPMRAVRVRADGRIAPQDMGLLEQTAMAA